MQYNKVIPYAQERDVNKPETIKLYPRELTQLILEEAVRYNTLLLKEKLNNDN